MPRDLTDLMERATAFAPAEPHDAADITRLAARHQQRRTAAIAGGLVLAVVVAGVTGYGVTRTHDSSPVPAGPYRYGQTVDLSDAVPASTVAGYRLEPWSIASVQHPGPRQGPLATYHSIDADGRLIVVHRRGPEPFQVPEKVRLYDGPGQQAQPLQVPTSPGSNEGRTIGWTPSFLDDGRLVWVPSARDFSKASSGFHVTDLRGGNDLFVPSGFHVGNGSFDGTPGTDHQHVSEDDFWFPVYQDHLPDFGGSAYSVYHATFSGELTEVAEDVATMALGGGRVAWVTTSGELVTEDSAGGPQRRVDVPLTPGCRMPSPQELQTGAGTGALAVDDSVIAMAESCGEGKDQRLEMLAFDLSGRLLVHVTGVYAFDPSFGDDSLVFVGLELPVNQTGTFRYDLVTGTLARLDIAGKGRMLHAPRVAGDYVLWYDGAGGHVARFDD
jgi:hypothetical protein